jgi:hypothetical protein
VHFATFPHVPNWQISRAGYSSDSSGQTKVCRSIPVSSSRKNRTHEKDLQNGLRKMNEEFRKKIENVEPQQVKAKIRKNRYSFNLPFINIAIINATGFHRNLQKEGNVTFNTSLYEIDRLIEEKQISTIVNEEMDE